MRLFAEGDTTMRIPIREAPVSAVRGRFRSLRDEKGSFTVEAALCLPLFLLGVLTIAFCIRIVGVQGAVMQIAADETGRLALDTYAAPAGVLFEPALTARVYEQCEDVSRADVRGFRYLVQRSGRDGIISYSLLCDVDLPLPFPAAKGQQIRTTVAARAWIGKQSAGEPMPFSEMEEDGNSITVWVFPQRGERYHTAGCTFVANKPRQMVLTQSLKGRYDPCPICDSAELPEGSLVYCYPAYGEVYHRANCSQVDKYIVPMDKEDAESRGYTPCSKCGGY